MGNYTQYVGDFSKKMLRLPTNTVNGAAEYELGRERRRGEMFCKMTKF
jgi:hypothetical protein